MVQSVKIHTPGAVVTTADILMTVVPDSVGFEVEANVDNGDIGFVREGQEAEIKIEAFPFTRYGLLKGHIRKLGRDAAVVIPGGDHPSAPETTPTPLSYPAKIALSRDWIAVDATRERLRPGMAVSAEIKTGDRRVIEYLLSPVIQTLSEAGRER